MADEQFEDQSAKTETIRYAMSIVTTLFAQRGYTDVSGNILPSETRISQDTPTQISVIATFGMPQTYTIGSITTCEEVTNV